MTNNELKLAREVSERINKRDDENRKIRNAQIDEFGMAFIIEDRQGNTFTFARIENGIPLYRTFGDCVHIFSLNGYKIIQQYDEG